MFSIYNKDRFAYRRRHEWIFIPTTKKHFVRFLNHSLSWFRVQNVELFQKC